MKLFMSYGHDGNAVLVLRIKADLEAAGHTVWVDTAEIKGGDDWRRSITDGLVDSHYVLGFLSKHSVRDPGVCLDELAIALHVKGGTIATVLLEGDAAPPLSVSHIQWLDMHDWAERQGREGFEAWYRAKLDALLAILDNPATQRFAGEIREIEERLQPVAQQADIGALVDRFIGREWLAEKVDVWRRSGGDSRLLWITGGPGAGKSAFAAWLAHRGRLNVIGLNLCAYNKEDRCDAGRVVRTLAFQVATRLPDYRRLLVDRLRLRAGEGADVLASGPAGLFAALLVEPLRVCIDGGRSGHRFLVIIDGLDETVRGGRSDLAEILAAEAGKLPPCIGIVATSRREDAIVRQFGGFNPVEISATAPENLQDVRDYLDAWLADAVPDAAARPAMGRRIAEASGGNFLYLSMLRSAVASDTLKLDAAEDFPPGLTGLYTVWFQRRFPDETAYALVRPALSVLVASSNHVPPDWLSRILGLSKLHRTRILEALGTLVERRPEGLTLFHKSLRDWLLDPDRAGARYVIEEEEGAGPLRDLLWATFVRSAQEGSTDELDPFCIAELPVRFNQCGSEVIDDLLSTAGDTASVRHAGFSVASEQSKRNAFVHALSWLRMIITLSSHAGQGGLADKALGQEGIGNLLRRMGHSTEALGCFRESLALRERLAADDPDNADRQCDVMVSVVRIGDVLLAQGNGNEAFRSFREGLTKAELMVSLDPANPDRQRDLSACFMRIGRVHVANGNRPDALSNFRTALSICERLAGSNPANTLWQYGLSDVLNVIGSALMAQGDRAGASRHFARALDIARRLAAIDATRLDVHSLLSNSLDSFGSVQLAEGDLSGALETFREALAFAERLTTFSPENSGWQQNLAVLIERIAQIQTERGDRTGSLKSIGDALAIRKRLCAIDSANADWQYRLSVSFGKRGRVQLAKGDGSGALQSYRDALSIRRRLSASDLANADWRCALVVSLNEVGGVQLRQGDREGALTSYRDALRIMDELHASDPANTEWQLDRSESIIGIGDVLLGQDDRAGALECYRASQDIRARLVEVDPDNTIWQHELALSFDAVGDVSIGLDDKAGLLTSFLEAMAIRRRLTAIEPGNMEWARELSLSLVRVGNTQLTQGDRPGALKSFQESRAIQQRLSETDPTNTDWQCDLSVLLDRIGDVRMAQGDRIAARDCFRESLAICERLATLDPANAEWQRNLCVSYARLAEVDDSQAKELIQSALYIVKKMQEKGILAAGDGQIAQELMRRMTALRWRRVLPPSWRRFLRVP